MRVLWTHNFDPSVQTSGVFMHTAARGLRACGIELHLEYVGNLRSISQILRARRRIRELARGFDIVHAQYGSACALVTAAAENIPKILTIRGSDWQVHHSSVGFLYFHTRLAALLTRLSIGRYQCVTAVSQRILTDLPKTSPAVQLTVLPSPIDLSSFVPMNKGEARKKLGYAENDEKWVLFNSRNLQNPVKRFGLAKQAFESAKARHSNLRLQLATGLDHEKMPLFTAACDVILCTSENEGWPNSIKEALACNVPFVSTDVGDLHEIASVEPSCRICSADAGRIAENICQVLAGAEPQNLRKHVRDMSLEATSNQLISVYQSLLS